MSRRWPIVTATLAVATITGVGAATIHRFAATNGTGSEGAFTYNNTSTSGAAIEGTVSTAPDKNVTLPFGMLGEYLASSSTFGIGAGGVSTSGYGVGAESLGVNPALYAIAKGAGSDGADIYGGTGTNGYSVTGAAGDLGMYVESETVADAAIVGNSAYHNGSAYGGLAAIGVGTGEGVIAYGYSTNAQHPAIAAIAYDGKTDYIGAFDFQAPRFAVQAASQNRSGATSADMADVQVSGDLYLTGAVYQRCTTFPATTSTACDAKLSTQSVTRSSDGTDVSTYTAKASLPKIEDTGAGHIAAGIAYVALDPKFARTISASLPYDVLITPYGESRGLYVARRTPSGFEVRENAGGRSSIDFNYRVVATPLGDRSERFPTVVRSHPQVAIAPREPFGKYGDLKAHVPPRDLFSGLKVLH